MIGVFIHAALAEQLTRCAPSVLRGMLQRYLVGLTVHPGDLIRFLGWTDLTLYGVELVAVYSLPMEIGAVYETISNGRKFGTLSFWFRRWHDGSYYLEPYLPKRPATKALSTRVDTPQ